MSNELKDVIVRAVKTFVQAYIAVLMVADQPLSREVQLAAVAAAVSAVWNVVYPSIKARLT